MYIPYSDPNKVKLWKIASYWLEMRVCFLKILARKRHNSRNVYSLNRKVLSLIELHSNTGFGWDAVNGTIHITLLRSLNWHRLRWMIPGLWAAQDDQRPISWTPRPVSELILLQLWGAVKLIKCDFIFMQWIQFRQWMIIIGKYTTDVME
jgi:hypothetical protein